MNNFMKFKIKDNDDYSITSKDFVTVNEHFKKRFGSNWVYEKEVPSTGSAISIFSWGECGSYLTFQYGKDNSYLIVTNCEGITKEYLSDKLKLKLEDCLN